MKKFESLENEQVTPEEIKRAMSDLGLDIPEVEKADMKKSPVSQKEMDEAVEALAREENPAKTLEEFQPPSDEALVGEANILSTEDLPKENAMQERLEKIRRSLEEEGSGIKLNTKSSNGGNNNIKTSKGVTYGGNRRGGWIEGGTRYDRMHGNDTLAIFRRVFGKGLTAMLNLFRPSLWKKYNKMMKENSDDSLTRKTSYRRDSKGNEEHWTHY